MEIESVVTVSNLPSEKKFMNGRVIQPINLKEIYIIFSGLVVYYVN